MLIFIWGDLNPVFYFRRNRSVFTEHWIVKADLYESHLTKTNNFSPKIVYRYSTTGIVTSYGWFWKFWILLFVQSCLTLCNPMDYSTPGFPIFHHFLGFAYTLIHRVSDAIQPSHPLLSPSPTLNLSQHQGLFQWAGSYIWWPKYWSFSFSIRHEGSCHSSSACF